MLSNILHLIREIKYFHLEFFLVSLKIRLDLTELFFLLVEKKFDLTIQPSKKKNSLKNRFFMGNTNPGWFYTLESVWWAENEEESVADSQFLGINIAN